MSKHTPGEWAAIEWRCHAKTTVVVEDASVVTGKRVIADVETSEDDARLIAAAPELLEALQSAEMALIGYIHQNDITRNALQKIRAAVTKATGDHQK